MTDSEKLDLILDKVGNLVGKIDKLEGRIGNLESRIGDLESRMSDLEGKFVGLEEKMDVLDAKMTRLDLHIENGTDKNIQLVAENFVDLTKKLNQAIPVADKNLAYEVKVNYLTDEVEKLKRELADLKNKIA